jgi:mannosyl-3-phosphoglycerate phosphatase
VVFCSSKTAAEIQSLLCELNLCLPFIAENGGGIFLPEGDATGQAFRPSKPCRWSIIELGTPYPRLVSALAEVKQKTGAPIRGFAEMSAQEIAARCGLGLAQAELAKQRSFDEPFIVDTEDAAAIIAVRQELELRGLRLTRGGRFLHATGVNDKGVAIRWLNSFGSDLQAECSIAIGDGANDVPMFHAADLGILVQRPDGSHDAEVIGGAPCVIAIPASGAEAWSRIVTALASLDGCSVAAAESAIRRAFDL